VLKIGEFSALTQVSIKTLRYYDEVGLLNPVRIDPETGYRYYSASQLPRLHRILALKDLGFPLNRVAEALDEGSLRTLSAACSCCGAGSKKTGFRKSWNGSPG
jgi:DNA-binding transcriptional MerR regulator